MNNGIDAVIGGAGFIGSHISRRLLAEGRRVRIIDNFSTGKKSNIADLAGRCEVLEVDIRNESALDEALQGVEFVFHQGALPSVARSIENPSESNSVNVQGTLNVLLSARKSGVRKVVFASSSSVYGNSPTLPKIEDMKANPLSPYALTKYSGELYCKIFSEIYGLPTVSLRYFNVFGPFQDPKSEYAAVIPRFITRMLAGQAPIVFGDGEQSRDFTFIENVVKANLLAARSSASGIAVNIACGGRFTLNQLIENLKVIIGCGAEPLYQDPRPGDVRHSEAAIELAGEMIGYRPAVPFLEGLERTVQWFQKETRV